MIARRPLLLGLASLPLLLAGCGRGEGTGGRTSIVFGEQRSMRPMGDASRVMEGAPYDFKWATFATPSVIFEAFRSGDVDVASSNDITILNAAANGVKLKIVGAMLGGLQKAVGIVVKKDLPVRTVKDLKGRKIIVSSARGGSGDNMLHGALREAGLSAGDVTISYAPFIDSIAAFKSDAIDVLVTNDPYLIVAEQHGGRVIRNGVGLNAGLALIVASDAALADPAKRAAIGDMLGRLDRGVDWARDHPEEYARYYARAFSVDLSLVEEMQRRTVFRMEPISPEIVALTQKVADGLVTGGFWPKPLDVRPFFDATVFQQKAPT
ncbi:ABC transporter substrate-binding protein [Sphingomonas naphthae]|uniref:ABC transporter substrate-binding protein n=1 Tax=Sphingomonas naphthae TaxID=1813468 RepID=A0ABY7TLP6_9SPHN|nr:ABC transporter substrate-binding protein [Sphingomonas naphthae]WCT74163.1 ABC transporter substrate-binding protein [Sphingomonas naphthae]